MILVICKEKLGKKQEYNRAPYRKTIELYRNEEYDSKKYTVELSTYKMRRSDAFNDEVFSVFLVILKVSLEKKRKCSLKCVPKSKISLRKDLDEELKIGVEDTGQSVGR